VVPGEPGVPVFVWNEAGRRFERKPQP
jgi:hypothetical protein